MRVIYVAGPFTGKTAWDIEQNVRAAEDVGLCVANAGAVPLIPHANTRYFHGQQTPEFWYDATLELLKRCDGIIMVDGWESSKGSVMEHTYAKQHGIPIFYASKPSSWIELERWVQEHG